jgi:hypothetical protein
MALRVVKPRDILTFPFFCHKAFENVSEFKCMRTRRTNRNECRDEQHILEMLAVIQFQLLFIILSTFQSSEYQDIQNNFVISFV